MNDVEKWLPVIGFEGRYEISDCGRLRSYVRSIEPRLMSPAYERGYLKTGLSRGDGTVQNVYLHRIVLEAFCGVPPADGIEACHINGVRDDNRLSNLYWGTRSDNMQDAIRHGTHPTASKTHCKRGHPFDEANTIALVGGRRSCRECARMHGRELWRKQSGYYERNQVTA